MACHAIQVLIVGPADASLFADVVSIVRDAGPAIQVHEIDSLAEIAKAPFADLVIVLQLWPDQYPRAEVLRLIGAAPFARLLVCYGSWCESDERTREIWPLGSRVPIAAASPRLQRELQGLRDASPPLPLTATRNEHYAHSQSHRPPAQGESLSIAICSCGQALSEWLQDLLITEGHSIVEVGFPSADLLLWDADPWGAASRKDLSALQAASHGGRVVALCGFPRPHEVRELQSAGADAVVPKSFDNVTLLERLETVAAQRHVVSLASAAGNRARRIG